MWTRRRFLSRAGAVTGCLGVGRAVPWAWARAAGAAETAATDRRLVVIELQGGNDGLNTVVPYADDAYYRARPTLAVPAKDVVKLDDQLGLHPAMKSWRGAWDSGRLAIIENCGYPQPNRSHFESMDVWHAGQVGGSSTSGWLGRASDNMATGELCHVGDGTAPRALAGRRRFAASLAKLDDLRFRGEAPQAASAPAAEAVGGTDENDLNASIAARLARARELAARLQADAPAVPTGIRAKEPLTERLEVIRTLIERDEPFRVYYTSLEGFDTHAAQRYTHQSLLRQTTEAVAGFLDKLKQSGRGDVVVFLFSEFGRRVRENGSQGTDHGAAAPVFLLGDAVRGGVQGGVPDLKDLDDGDVRHRVDFRDVYAALLRDWLAVDPAAVLGPGRTPLSLFR
jgi:uncharacterized protein (DUF1501 family)